MTELLFLRDAYLTECTATVVDVRDNAVVLDRTVFYYTGGGQPHDTGLLDGQPVVDVRKDGNEVLHVLADGAVVPGVGATVQCSIDWDRRFRLMRSVPTRRLRWPA